MGMGILSPGLHRAGRPVLPQESGPSAAEEASRAIHIGSRRELFVDDALIERMQGANLRLHHPIPQEVVMRYDKPWEGSGCSFRTVFQDGNLYRMYYTSWNLAPDGHRTHPFFIGYAESKDGIEWVRPDLGLAEYEGSHHNNIVLSGIHGQPIANFSPFIDANPASTPDAKYKAVGLTLAPSGIYIFKSPDGIHWKPISDTPVIVADNQRIKLDTQNLAFWDTESGKYRIYLRGLRDGKMRDILTAASADFDHWDTPRWITYRNAPPDEQLYTNCIKPYYRAPHIYFGFPVRYVDRGWTSSAAQLPEQEARKQRSAANPRYGAAVTDTLFMVSRDGEDFFRWPEAFITPGLKTKDNWSYGDNYMAWQLLETPSVRDDMPRELSMYATESYFTHNSCQLRRYTMRIDGFVSAYAHIYGGEVVTKPVVFAGRSLHINYASSAGGSIRIAMLNGNGVPLDGYGEEDCDIIYGDQLERIVTWKGKDDVSALAGQAVRLRFILADAHLYSFRFAE